MLLNIYILNYIHYTVKGTRFTSTTLPTSHTNRQYTENNDKTIVTSLQILLATLTIHNSAAI